MSERVETRKRKTRSVRHTKQNISISERCVCSRRSEWARDSFSGLAIFVLNSMYLMNSSNCLYQLWQGRCDSLDIFSSAFMFVSLSYFICYVAIKKTHNVYEIRGKKSKVCCYCICTGLLSIVLLFFPHCFLLSFSKWFDWVSFIVFSQLKCTVQRRIFGVYILCVYVWAHTCQPGIVRQFWSHSTRFVSAHLVLFDAAFQSISARSLEALDEGEFP